MTEPANHDTTRGCHALWAVNRWVENLLTILCVTRSERAIYTPAKALDSSLPTLMAILLELLEDRIAPATLIDGKTVEFTDVDNDVIRVQLSRSVLTAQNWQTHFDFQSDGAGHDVLENINFASPAFSGIGIGISVFQKVSPDGKVNIGALNAGGVDLDKVVIAGGLVKISAGDLLTPTKGINLLKVDSLGFLDPQDFNLLDRSSTIQGKLGELSVSGNLGGSLTVNGGQQAGIGKISVGGSLLAGAGSLSGTVSTNGGIGSVFIGGSIDGRLADTPGEASITTRHSIGSLTVKGSVIAGSTELSGTVSAFYNIGPVVIDGNLGTDASGSTPAASYSGSIFAEHGRISSLTLGSSLLGGDGDFSGFLQAESGVGAVKILGSIRGGNGLSSGSIQTFGAITSLSVGGSILGGQGPESGSVNSSGRIGALTVAGSIVGDVVSGGENSARIQTEDSMGTVFVGGDLEGGAGDGSGTILAVENITKATIRGEIQGGTGVSSGVLTSTSGSLLSVEVGLGLDGGAGAGSGSIFSQQGFSSVKILAGGLDGGNGEKSGSIISDGEIKILSIFGDLDGAGGTNSASVSAGALGTGTFVGSLIGGSGTGSGGIYLAGKLTSLSTSRPAGSGFGGSVIGGSGEGSGSIMAKAGIGSVLLAGNLTGGSGLDSGSIQAGSETENASIGMVKIQGNVAGNTGIRSASILGWGGNMALASIGGSVTGGDGLFSALIYANNTFTKAEILGNLTGGTGDFSGRVATDTGALGAVLIGGNLLGSDGINSGTIYAGTTIGTVTIKGSVTGGNGDCSGAVGVILSQNSLEASDRIASIVIGSRLQNPESLKGGSGNYSGSVVSIQSMGPITIFGTLEGGLGNNSGSIESLGTLASVSAIHVLGGQGENSGRVHSAKALGKVILSGHLQGGAGIGSGSVTTDDSLSEFKSTGIIGGDAAYSGRLFANKDLKTVNVLGSVMGGDFGYSGSIIGGTSLGSLSITGNLTGGDNAAGRDVERTGCVLGGKIGAVSIGGNISSGTVVDPGKKLVDSGSIRSTTTIGSLKVGGSMIGNSQVPVLITSELLVGPIASNVTIGTLEVKNHVSHAVILAGASIDNSPAWNNPFAQITSVKVGGNWTASSISAGAQPGPNGYGSGDSASPQNVANPVIPAGNFSKIGSLTIAGTVAGGDPGDQFGFVAANFGTITIGGQKIPSPAAGWESDLSIDGSVKIHRLPTLP